LGFTEADTLTRVEREGGLFDRKRTKQDEPVTEKTIKRFKKKSAMIRVKS